MRIPFCLLLIGSFCTNLSAQKKLPEFGGINVSDLAMSSCSFEPGASAMKLFDVQKVEFDPFVGKFIIDKRIRIKIFNEKGYEHATVKIPFYSKKNVSKIKNLKGAVYNFDESGKATIEKLDKNDFFKEKVANDVGLINFTFPHLKPGSVLEFSYTEIEKNTYEPDVWELQDDIPVAYCETTLITPDDLHVKEKIIGIDSIGQSVEKIKGAREKRIYFKENINSFSPEPFMTSESDNLLRVKFLLIRKNDITDRLLASPEVIWNYAGLRFLESADLGKQIKKQITGTSGIIDTAKKIASISERIKFVFDAVKKRIPENVEQTLDANDIEDAWQNKNGNSTEINLILLNLLEKADVPCCPVLISTRSHGMINTDFPSLSQFNGMDALALDGKTAYVMDASLKGQAFNNPPFNVMNRKAFLVIKDHMDWAVINDERPLLKQEVIMNASFKGDDGIEGNVVSDYFDYSKLFVIDSTNKDEKDNSIAKKADGLKIVSEKMNLPENDIEPVEQQLGFNYQLQNQGDFYFINPQFLFSQKKNPFTNATRNSDIDFGCNQKLSFSMKLDIPPTHQVEFLPKSITIRAMDSSFFYKRTCTANASQINYEQTFEIKRSVFDKEEYRDVQEFFKRAYALMTEEIIIKKKK